MRLKYQLFLTLLAASAVLIALMYVFSSWSFSRGFLEYVNQNEEERLLAVSERIADRYTEEGNWLWVDRQALKRIEGFSGRGTRSNRRTSGPKPKNGPPNGPPRRPLILTDSNKNTLFGAIRSDRQMQWLAVETDAGVVGYLVAPKLERIDQRFDQAFEDKQKKTLGMTALAMILFSGLLSIPLAGRIVKPLLTVNKAVGEISSGNYAHRVGVSRRDEIGDLADNINTLGHTLEQNREARQRWIAEISHELRTPLAVLRGEIEAVQDGVRTMDKQAVASLHGEVLSLGRLIDDLHTLSISDVGALDYQREEIDLAGLLTNFIESHEDAIASNDITLTSDVGSESTMVNGDAQRLEQLFSNLMQNTCRYTDAGGKLHVALQKVGSSQSEPVSRSVAVIDWFDSTPGVADDALSKLFDPLFRTETSRNREFGGTGLGLSIAKRIVEAHQGDISAKQSNLGGLHIQIKLPVYEGSV